MERLQVSEFLTIKHADFEVSKINLIIGQQASGKSILTKLLYFFREFLSDTYVESVRNTDGKRELERASLNIFESYFPKYTWGSKDFSIVYEINDVQVQVYRKTLRSGRVSLRLDYSKNLVTLHRHMKQAYVKAQASEDFNKPPGSGMRFRRDPFYEIYRKYILESEYHPCFQDSVFIPASRTFFANLQKNVFSFLAGNIEIDPFLKDFGSTYEHVKRYLDTSFFDSNEEKLLNEINPLIEKIMVGNYAYDDEKDWIIHKDKKTNVVNSSSGQQESLPMLLVLRAWGVIRGPRSRTFFIEEPEAHLFPLSQKHIMSLVSTISSNTGHSFVINTHSPYILTALNNMILSYDILNEFGQERVNGLIEKNLCVNIDDVRAYTFEKGKLVSIIDSESRMIGASVIDSVSDVFDEEFDRLIQYKMSNSR